MSNMTWLVMKTLLISWHAVAFARWHAVAIARWLYTAISALCLGCRDLQQEQLVELYLGFGQAHNKCDSMIDDR